jgi:hypothetical protein
MEVVSIGPFRRPVIKRAGRTLAVCHTCNRERCITGILIRPDEIPDHTCEPDEAVRAEVLFECGHNIEAILI